MHFQIRLNVCEIISHALAKILYLPTLPAPVGGDTRI